MKTSQQFYTQLTAAGLAARKKAVQTKKELSYLKKLLDKKQKILDVGCGYGRFTIPLAKSGYSIEGIDITPSLIKKAQQVAIAEQIPVVFAVGDMRKLSYEDDSFGTIICMWSVFIELTKKSDQLRAIKEMLRVLKKDGFALLEMALPLQVKYFKDEKSGDEVMLKRKISTGKLSNIERMPEYEQDEKSLSAVMAKTNCKKYKVFIDNFGGRDRLFLQFWK